jgi:hypothetical protein
MVSIQKERLEAGAYHGAKNSTSISEALFTESSKVAAVSFKTSETTSDVPPSAKTRDVRASANAGVRSAEIRMRVGRKENV